LKVIDYSIRIKGLKSKSGSIPISALKEISDVLLKSSDRILRLMVEGSSTKTGKTPNWLKKTLNFTITGIKTGSTIIEVEAPVLSETMPEFFEQKKLWQDRSLKSDDSALSLLSKSVSDAVNENTESEYFDSGVLDSLFSFRTITNNYASEVSITSKNKSEDNFKIGTQEIAKIKKVKVTTPKSNTVVVAGFFNLIEHSNRRFQLKMENGKTINGIMDPSQIDLEHIRELWGKRVTIKGKANYKPSGNIRNIEAQLVQAFESGDEIFQQVPGAQKRFEFAEKFLTEKSSSKALKKVWGKWPGNESIDDLLIALQQSPA